MPVEKLVFLDECGFGLNLHRLYSWAIGGGRCVEEVPFERGQNRSVLGALSLPTPTCPTGMRALWQKLGAWTRVSFEAFLQDGLLPLLEPGSVLVLDNASIHRGGDPSRWRDSQIGRGSGLFCALPAALLARPQPYRTRVELDQAPRWIKHRFGAQAPGDDQSRQSAIQDAARQLPPSAAVAWLKHCGLIQPD